MKVIIIGGVAGGASTAARLRRLDESAEIIVMERTGYVSYANCGLPYYIGGTITKKSELTLQTPESFWNRFHIDVRVSNEVIAIDPEKKQVTVKCLTDQSQYVETYDKLVLSPGARSAHCDVPGADGDHIMSLRTVEDTFKISEFVQGAHPEHVTVIGGGFIGLEMAENLLELGVKTTLLQRSAQVMPPLDRDMAAGVQTYLRDKGLDLRLNTPVDSYEQTGGRVRVVLRDKDPFVTDLVIMAIGVVPDTELAAKTGLKLGVKGTIEVDDHMRTSIPDIYAVGDAVQVKNFVTGEAASIPLAGPANKQGRIAADNICGLDATYKGSQGSSIIKLFDMAVATTGINEKAAQCAGISYDYVVVKSASHATYYPGSTDMTVKALFKPETGEILGAQIVGFEGVDKRIDVMATAIRAHMTAADLEDLDLAYAPPFSSAKDPVNMAGFVIENVRAQRMKQFFVDEADELGRRADVVLLDARTPREFERGHIPGAVNIELDSLREHLDELDKSKPYYIYCHSGLRSYVACRDLQQRGYDCYNLAGGHRFYKMVKTDEKYETDPTYLCGVAIEK